MNILLAVVVAATLFVLWARWTEPRMLYLPSRRLEDSPARLGWSFEDVSLTTSDGVRLHAWWIPAGDDSGRAPLSVLFLHGNAGNLSHRLDKLAILREVGVDVLILDYRGYGESQGSPDEPGTVRDARAGYDELVLRRGRDARSIVLYGESLGAAVAAQLAGRVEVAGIVLESAFTSAADMAQSLFPVLPVRWVMRNRYETLRALRDVRAPLLILHSREDEIVPFEHAERLAAARRDSRLVALTGGHNEAFLESGDTYRRALATFMAEVAGAAGEASER